MIILGDDMAVKNRLKFYREQRKLNQNEFSIVLGVNVNQYNKWENHRIQMTIDRAFDICKKLGIKIDDLFYEETN
jgi:DNA-binding XRE family transcriptional regulator